MLESAAWLFPFPWCFVHRRVAGSSAVGDRQLCLKNARSGLDQLVDLRLLCMAADSGRLLTWAGEKGCRLRDAVQIQMN